MLLGNKLIDAFYLRCVNKGTLYTHRFTTIEIKHVTLTNQLLGTRTVKNRAGVNHGTNTESDTTGEVRLDGTSDDICRRTLGRYNHVDADGTRQLGDTGNRKLHFLSCRHDQITKLIDDDDNIGHEAMSVIGIQLSVDEFLIVLLDITSLRYLQQVITGIHLLTQRVQGAYHFRDIGNDGVCLLFRYFRQEMLVDGGIDAELHFFRVDEYDLQFCGMLLI